MGQGPSSKTHTSRKVNQALAGGDGPVPVDCPDQGGLAAIPVEGAVEGMEGTLHAAGQRLWLEDANGTHVADIPNSRHAEIVRRCVAADYLYRGRLHLQGRRARVEYRQV